MNHLLARIDATPEQSRVVHDAFDEVLAEARVMREEATHSRADVADAIAGDDLDEEVMGELFTRHDDRLRELRKAFVGALARVHEVLDEDQRAKLARGLKGGGLGGFGPFRTPGRPGRRA